MNTPGSLTFGTSVITTEEFIVLAKTMKQNGSSNEIIAADISAIDDMLSLCRVAPIINKHGRFTAKGRLRKDYDLISLLDKRIDQLTEECKPYIQDAS